MILNNSSVNGLLHPIRPASTRPAYTPYSNVGSPYRSPEPRRGYLPVTGERAVAKTLHNLAPQVNTRYIQEIARGGYNLQLYPGATQPQGGGGAGFTNIPGKTISIGMGAAGREGVVAHEGIHALTGLGGGNIFRQLYGSVGAVQGGNRSLLNMVGALGTAAVNTIRPGFAASVNEFLSYGTNRGFSPINRAALGLAFPKYGPRR